MTNPSRHWAELGSKTQTPTELCEGIVNILIHHCFVEEVVPVANLRQAMPAIYNKLTVSNPENRSSSIALDAARTTGLFDICKAKKDAEDRLVFEAAIIMLLYLRRDIVNYNYPYKTIQEFLAEYPEFNSETEEEVVKLFNFANCMKVAIQLIKPKLHKSQLLVLCTRLTEGKGVKYVTGSGQKAETKRRVAIYEHEGGVKAEARPWRLSWSLVTQLLCDEKETVADVDMSQKLITTLQEQPEMRDLDLNQETVRFRHPNLPNVHVEATEMKTASGQTLMRATSLSRVREDDAGNVVEATELHREFSITGEVAGVEDLAWLNEFDEALTNVENFSDGDYSVSRQSVRQDGQLVRNITVSRQFPEAIENVANENYSEGQSFEDSMAELSDILGSSITRQFSGGTFGLLRSLSTGSPRPPGSVMGGLSTSPRDTSNTLLGALSTGLLRMNSSGNSVLPLSSTSSLSGLIRSFSGGANALTDVGHVQTPILVFPNGGGIATYENGDHSAKNARPLSPSTTIPDPQQQPKRSKIENNMFSSDEPAEGAGTPSTAQWGEFYKSFHT
jgi:hypothetical protein